MRPGDFRRLGCDSRRYRAARTAPIEAPAGRSDAGTAVGQRCAARPDDRLIDPRRPDMNPRLP
jgi:hypothetical protein